MEPLGKRTVIVHYGVKGMRWGVRRSQAQLDRAANRRAATSVTNKRKEARGLSTQELQSRISRINLERQYVNLTAQPSALSRGGKMVGTILGQTAKNVAVSQLTRQANTNIDNLIKNKFK